MDSSPRGDCFRMAELLEARVHKNYNDTNLKIEDTNLKIEDNLKNGLGSSSKVQELLLV